MWVQVPCYLYDLQIFSPICGYHFSFLMVSFDIHVFLTHCMFCCVFFFTQHYVVKCSKVRQLEFKFCPLLCGQVPEPF